MTTTHTETKGIASSTEASTENGTELYHNSPVDSKPEHLHVVERGTENATRGAGGSQTDIVGYDPDLMRSRAILDVEQEKTLLRRVDWRLLPLLSLMFVVKNVDIANVHSHGSQMP